MNVTVRCSNLPLFWKCPESALPADDEVLINQSNDQAEVGTALHRYAAGYISGTAPKPQSLADEHGVSLDELNMLIALWRKQWEKIESMIGAHEGMYTEHRVGSTYGDDDLRLTIKGTADLIALPADESVVVVVDWKTGRVDSDYAQQQRGYAAGVTPFTEDVKDVVAITVWVREQQWDVLRMTPAEIHEWKDTLHTRAKNGLGNFNPGGHCQYCQRAASCPGRREMLQSAIADLTVEGVNTIPWTPETRTELGPQIGEMYSRVKLVEKACGDFRDRLKDDLKEHGELPIGDGRSLRMMETSKRVVDPAKARDVLREHVTDEDIDRATTISISQIEKAVAANAPRGRGKASIERLRNELVEAGALRVVDGAPRLHEGRATEDIGDE